MKHVIWPDGHRLEVTFYCSHPKLKDNICPTGSGECGKCRHCKAETSAEDMLWLINRRNNKES